MLVLDFMGAVNTVDRSVLFKSMPPQHPAIIFVNAKRGDNIRDLSQSLPTDCSVRKACLVSPFLQKLLIDELMLLTLFVPPESSIHVIIEEQLVDLE